MENAVGVKFFGEFQMQQGDRMIDEQTIHSKKILKLLAYLLLNRNRMVGIEELNRFLWGENGSVNPTGALKNLIYRLRSTLKELGDQEYIYYKSGAYGWNPKIGLWTDLENFKEEAGNARSLIGDVQERLRAYEKVIYLYKKPESSRLTSDAWMAVRFAGYHSLFIRTIREACSLCAEEADYERMKQISEYALACGEGEEEVYYWLLRSWIGLGDTECALEQYEIAVKNLYEQAGTHRSSRMGELYEEIISMKHTQTASMEEIYQDICEAGAQEIFFCEYSVFREIYRLEARRALRTGDTEYLILLTVCIDESCNEGRDYAAYYKKRAMEKLLTTLALSLRKADIAARYSENQYVVMLPTCDSQSANKVVKRILQTVNKKIGNKKVRVQAEMKEVRLKDSLLPQQ